MTASTKMSRNAFVSKATSSTVKRTSGGLLRPKRSVGVDESFFKLMDLNPWRQEKVDGEAFMAKIANTPALCQRMYGNFSAFDDDLLYPLHLLCALAAPLDCIKACIKACPDAVAHGHDTRVGTPLHVACTFGAPLDVVRYLVKKDKNALQATNEEGKTPLHLACEYLAHTQVILFLTAKAPLAAAKVDVNGMTPLNLACSCVDTGGATPIRLAVVEDLTEVHAAAGVVRSSSTNGARTPLLNAIRCRADAAVLRDLIVSNPSSASIRDEQDGCTPLHKALAHDDQLYGPLVVKDLIRVFPDALGIRDSQGRLALHVALECHCTLAVVVVLVTKNPASVETKNAKGEIPHQLAIRLGLDDDIVEYLNPFEEVSESAPC